MPCECEPTEVGDDEVIARAVFYSFHLKSNNRLKWQAFEADRGEDSISTMRTKCMTVSDCKARAKEMNRPNKTYRGFALLPTEAARKSGFRVQDSRHVYCGHADLFLDLKPEITEGEPPEDPEFRFRQKQAGESLLHIASCVIDAQANADEWIGDPPWVH